jgi:hypothetical protein
MDDLFWTHDTLLFAGAFHCYRDKKQEVRGKLHISEEKYDFNEFGHSLERNALKTAKGTRTYMLLHPYVREPNLIMSVALTPKQYADAGTMLGKTTGTRVEGIRDVQIGSAQAWYYPDDKIIVLWECFLDSFMRDLPLLKDPNMMNLWTGFEEWLINRYPEAVKMITPWADPSWQVKEYQSFLRKRGYKQERPGIFAKLLNY